MILMFLGSKYQNILFFFIYTVVTTVSSFNQSIEIRSEKLGLLLGSNLEVLSTQSSIVKNVNVGDIVVGVNNIALDNNERNIEYFTSLISHISYPYTIQIESTKDPLKRDAYLSTDIAKLTVMSNGKSVLLMDTTMSVSYTHLTLPTKRIV